MRAQINHSSFLPHLVLHETEAWVFAAARPLAELAGDRAIEADLAAIADQAGGPELVNDGPDTAPSKRLRQRMPAYRKTLEPAMRATFILPIAILALAALAALLARGAEVASDPADDSASPDDPPGQT